MSHAPRYYHHLQTPYGTCLIAATPDAITHVILGDTLKEALRELTQRLPQTPLMARHLPIHDTAIAHLQHTDTPAPPLSLEGTPFQLQVWRAVQDIPHGSTRTYAQIAAAIGNPRAVRAVGSAIGANPVALLIPCHRVCRADGTPGAYRWGAARKHALLRDEGAALS